MDCFDVCPEPQVIRPALKGEARGVGPVITDINCTNCGRCIDVCDREVFEFNFRWKGAAGAADRTVPKGALGGRGAHG